VQIFAPAILALWVASALADPLTLRVVEATPRRTAPPVIIVRFDADGRKAFAQFTAEHVGERMDWLVAGRVLFPGELLREPILGGVMNFFFTADEIVEVANRLQTEARIEAIANHLATVGRIEVDAIGRTR